MNRHSPLYESHKLSIIVPVYNLGHSILENIELLISEIQPYFSDYEVLVISDGSTDETNLRLASFSHPHCRTLFLEKNSGKGKAIRRGFWEAQGEFILFIDGGMELHPKEIRIFLGLMELYDADIVIGSKRHPQSQIEYPLLRRVLSSLYQYCLHRFFDLDVTDTQVGIKLFRRKVITDIRDHLEIDRYGFDLEVLALAKLKGHGKMMEAPIRLDYFHRMTRKGFSEFLHILDVGLSVAWDTYRVYRKIRRIRPGWVEAKVKSAL